MSNVVAFPAIEQQFEYELPLAAGAEQLGYVYAVSAEPARVEEAGQALVLLLNREEQRDHTATYQILPEHFGLSVDRSDHLRQVREESRLRALQLLECNRELNRSGDGSRAHLDVDALGTVDKAEMIKRAHGEDSPEYLEARRGLTLDYARKWAEAFRKNKEEYFEPTVQKYDANTDVLYANGLSVDEMLENGLSPLSEKEESDRRVNDYVLLQTHKEILKHPEADRVAVAQIMPCPDWALKSYQERPKGAHGGYAPEVEKLMIGFDWFDPEDQEVYHEQIAVPGTYYTMGVLNRVNAILDPEVPKALSKTDVHGTHFVVDRQKINRAMDVLKLLDAVATEENGVEVFMGQELAPGQEKDYEKLYQEAAQRRIEQQELTDELVDYVDGLYKEEVDHALATHMVEKFIDDRLLDIAEENHEIADAAFNTDTANGFRAAVALREQGRFLEAEELMQETRINAPPSSSCGAGSCGLESVDLKSKEGDSLKEKLDVEDGDEVVRDTERACSCGKKTIVYAYNKNKVNKYCTSCKAFESKVTKNGQ